LGTVGPRSPHAGSLLIRLRSRIFFDLDQLRISGRFNRRANDGTISARGAAQA
jgi:hypothetical protein